MDRKCASFKKLVADGQEVPGALVSHALLAISTGQGRWSIISRLLTLKRPLLHKRRWFAAFGVSAAVL